MAKIGKVADAVPNPQAIPVRGTKSGGSAPTPQASLPSVSLQRSSAPKNAQKLRG